MTYEEFLEKVNTTHKSSSPKKPRRFGVTDINEEECRLVLEGCTESLMGAFTWRSTAQGDSYWDSRHEGTEELSDDDLEFIRGLIE